MTTLFSPRRRRRAGQAFYLAVLIISLLAVFSLLRPPNTSQQRHGQPLEVRTLAQRDKECRFVHTVPVKDQCAFIRRNCPDEEAGLVSYLQLYYCSLAKAQPVAFIILVIWIGLLFSTIGIAASDFLCINLSTIATVLGMSESLTGVTFLAFGNGSPDVFSTFAAMSSHSGSLAVGELFGAAGFITAVVAASMALVKPFQVARKSFVRDVGFFIVAASFSMVFLVDGALHVWECAVMVAFYVFYVVFVVTWHWWLTRRRRRRLRETAARLHLHIPQTQELEVPEYRDDDEATPAHERTSLIGGDGAEDFSALEGAATPAWMLDDVDDDDEARDRYLAELRSNMRVSHAGRGHRRSTITPIRPSLIGALEFRAVLSSLERKSTNSPATPINLRRYSDDPSFSFSQGADNRSILSQPELTASDGNKNLRPLHDATRVRAVSADNASGLRLNTNVLNSLHGVPETAIYSASPLPANHRSQLSVLNEGPTPPRQSPPLLVLPSEPAQPTSTSAQSSSPGHLTPQGYFHRSDYQEQHQRLTLSPGNLSPMMKPRLEIPTINLPRDHSSVSTQASPFPMYTDSPAMLTPVDGSRPPSIRLLEPAMSPSSASEPYLRRQESGDEEEELYRYNWWPYTYLPPPETIASTLFPTVYGWRDKGIWDKMLGIVSVPSILLLAITLPVVETEQDESPPTGSPDLLTSGNKALSRAGTTEIHYTPDGPRSNGHLSPSQPQSQPHKGLSRQDSEPQPPARANVEELVSSSKSWNRWLVFVQIFTAPFFVVLIVWANTDDDHDAKSLLMSILGSLIFSLILLLILLATSSPDRPPKYRPLFCFLGFIVAIAWISTIANEVVGVLKAFGVILGISDAILGLTIFAVGNSLGDLVADITVAKLGYPVMALSACFGGPMLNILLGIGLSGLYITIRHGAHYHSKHPNKPPKYRPYEVEVSTTLVISGVTLLITLVGLLILVPLNGWRMDRKIGFGLIALWTLSTVGNVVIEILGYGGDLPGSIGQI